MSTKVTSSRTSSNSPHLLSITDLDREEIEDLLKLTDTFAEVGRRPIPKVPALRGRTVVMLFFEDSTRTRLSFETAAKRLSADTMSFAVSSSSLSKGESVRDTIETIQAMGIDAVVVRHKSSGVPAQIARWTTAFVINAGDGCHQHPTQALLDAYTARSHLGSLEGRHIAIVGDIKHSRVARSNIEIFTALGAQVTVVAPRTLLPAAVATWPVEVSQNLDEVIPTVDICYLLRMQQERMTEALVPSLREYTKSYGLTSARADRMAEGALIMHPGPMNRGVEIASEVADRPTAVITEQVSNGVAVRSAVLFMLLGAGRHLSISAQNDDLVSTSQLGMRSDPVLAESFSTTEETP